MLTLLLGQFSPFTGCECWLSVATRSVLHPYSTAWSVLSLHLVRVLAVSPDKVSSPPILYCLVSSLPYSGTASVVSLVLSADWLTDYDLSRLCFTGGNRNMTCFTHRPGVMKAVSDNCFSFLFLPRCIPLKVYSPSFFVFMFE